jgi:hypothetical protein
VYADVPASLTTSTIRGRLARFRAVDTRTESFALAPSRWRVVAPAAESFAVRALLVAYGFLLHAPLLWLLVYLALVALPAVIGLIGVIAGLIAPLPRVTAEGVHIRSSGFATTLTRLPWSEITRVWVTYFGRRRYFAVLAARREKPYFAPIPVGREAAEEALRVFSGGAVTPADGPPTWSSGWDPDTSRRAAFPRFRYGRARPFPVAVTILSLLVAIVVFPGIMGAQQPWNQPWFPGVTAATSVPDPCTVLSPATRQQLAVRGDGSRVGSRHDAICTFADLNGALGLRYRLATAWFGSSTAKASGIAGDVLAVTGTRPVPGLGDEARISASDGDAHLVIRKANVVVEIRYQGANAGDGAIQAGHEAVDAIVVS